MEKRIIELNEQEIKELILKRWSVDNDISSFGFFVEHKGLRCKDNCLFEGGNIKLKKIVFEFEGVKEDEFI